MNIKRFVYQKFIGYNNDFSKSWHEGVAEMEDGSMETLYSFIRLTGHGIQFGEWVRQRPFVERPETAYANHR